MDVHDTSEERFYSLVMLCATCHIPASRKLGGFVSFAAARGCNKCMKVFPCKVFGQKNDYSGFDKDNWRMRTNIEQIRSHTSAQIPGQSKRKLKENMVYDIRIFVNFHILIMFVLL